MFVPSAWFDPGVVKNFILEVAKKVAEHRLCHLIFLAGVWSGLKVGRWLQLKVWPLVEPILLGHNYTLLKLPEPARVTEVDPWERFIEFQRHGRRFHK